MKSFLRTFSTRAFVVLCSGALIAATLFFSNGLTRQAVAQSETPIGGRTMTVVSTSGTAGSQVTVSIELDSQGDEVAASFTLLFDPAVLSNPIVALGSGAPAGANLSINPSQIPMGRVGLLVDATTPVAVSPPNRQFVTVTFTILANAPLGASAIAFVSSPTSLSVSSALGALLPTVYQAGTVTVNAPTVQFVTVGGRVTTPSGQNLRNTTVSLIDSNLVRRVATTSTFGIYSFADVATGQTYTFAVTSKRYRFASQQVLVNAAINNLDFVGLE
jgi:hypothetical protein